MMKKTTTTTQKMFPLDDPTPNNEDSRDVEMLSHMPVGEDNDIGSYLFGSTPKRKKSGISVIASSNSHKKPARYSSQSTASCFSSLSSSSHTSVATYPIDTLLKWLEEDYKSKSVEYEYENQRMEKVLKALLGFEQQVTHSNNEETSNNCPTPLVDPLQLGTIYSYGLSRSACALSIKDCSEAHFMLAIQDLVQKIDDMEECEHQHENLLKIWTDKSCTLMKRCSDLENITNEMLRERELMQHDRQQQTMEQNIQVFEAKEAEYKERIEENLTYLNKHGYDPESMNEEQMDKLRNQIKELKENKLREKQQELLKFGGLECDIKLAKEQIADARMKVKLLEEQIQNKISDIELF